MAELKQATPMSNERRTRTKLVADARGFSLIEMLMVVGIGMILAALAIPSVKSSLIRYRLQGAIANSTWAIQSTRYQALMQGYPYQVVFTTSNNSYQIQNLPPGTLSYANVGNPVPLSGSPIILSADTTLQFKPNGFVTAAVGAYSYAISYNGICQKVTVTNYANISLAPIIATGTAACP